MPTSDTPPSAGALSRATPGATDAAGGTGGVAAEQLCREWYEAYGRGVYNYLRFHVYSPDAAEDLTAETFLRALRAAGQYDPARASAKTWIYRIAKNALCDYHRQARRRRFVPLGNLRDLACDAPSPEERLLWEEQVRELLEAVAELDGRDREVIGLRYGSGLDAAAAGEVLGISEAAVRTRLWRALKRLRRLLGS